MCKAFLLRSLVDDDEVGIRNHALCDCLVDCLGRHHCQNLLHELVLILRLHVVVIVEEVVDERIYKLGVLPSVSLLGGIFISCENVALCPFDFIVAEAVLLHFQHFGIECPECREGFAFLGGNITVLSFQSLAEAADAE